MDAEHARELLARERARIERLLADAKSREADEDPDPYEASDVAPDLFDRIVHDTKRKPAASAMLGAAVCVANKE